LPKARKEQKAEQVELLTEKLRTARVAVLTDYRGLTVSQIQDLRGKLRGGDVEYRVVKNTPAAAFALVAEPRNWSRYAPDIQLVESVDAPLRVGSRVHYRLRGDVRPLAVDETVIAYEPGRRFGTLVAPSTTAVYELNAVSGGTNVAFTQSEEMTIGNALFTAAAFRRAHLDRMHEVIEARLEAIKRLLEEQASVNV